MLKLKEIRIAKGVTVPQLSEVTGIHRRTIQDFEKRGNGTLSVAYKLAKALDVTLNDIYFEDDI